METSTEDTDAKSDENTVTGMISEITDSTITVAAMPGGGQGEAPGNPPSDNNGGAPAGNGNSDNNDSTEAPGKPDSDGADSTETPGNPLVETTILPLPTTAVPRIWQYVNRDDQSDRFHRLL